MVLDNVTVVTLDGLTSLYNVTSVPAFFVGVNEVVYGGWLWFVLLWVLWFILFVSAQYVRDQPLNNMMYAGAFCTVVSFFLRAVSGSVGGVSRALLSDYQMYLFPLLTIVLVFVIYVGKE